jgi:hypothetical protein
MILSLALLIGSAVGIAASAETAAPEIISQNVVYSGTLNFKFAIDADALGEGKTVTVNIYDKNPEEDGAVLLDTTTAVYEDVSDTNLGVQYAYVATSKAAISALNYGTEYYAQAVCDGVAGEAIKYSAVEYFLTRLYREGETVTDIQREHYENVLAYGSTTQKITGDTGINVADFVFVAAEDGKVNGKDSVIVEKGTEVTLTYTGADTGFAYYLDAAGNKLGSTAAVSTSGTLAARYADYTFNDLSNDTTFEFGSGSSSAITISDGSNDVSKYTGLLFGNASSSHSASIVDGVLKLTKTSGAGSYFGIKNKNYSSANNHTVFETDITFDLSSGGTVSKHTLALFRGTSNTLSEILMNYSSDTGNLEFKFRRNVPTGSNVTKDSSGNVISIAEAGSKVATCNLKIESYFINGDTRNDVTMVISVNDTPVMIGDSRAIADYSTIDSNLGGYIRNDDGSYFFKYFYTSKSSSDISPRDYGVFYGVSIETYSTIIGTFSYDNIIFESDTVGTEDIPLLYTPATE